MQSFPCLHSRGCAFPDATPLRCLTAHLPFNLFNFECHLLFLNAEPALSQQDASLLEVSWLSSDCESLYHFFSPFPNSQTQTDFWSFCAITRHWDHFNEGIHGIMVLVLPLPFQLQHFYPLSHTQACDACWVQWWQILWTSREALRVSWDKADHPPRLMRSPTAAPHRHHKPC